MQNSPKKLDRRREARVEANDQVRWKRPGRIEDHKAWMVDRGRSSLGFLAAAEAAPRVGEVLNIRRQDGDCWALIDGTIRVARATPTPNADLLTIGCTIE